MSDIITVNVQVKPYIRQYLVNNCGDPCDLTLLPEVHKQFLKYLTKPLFSRESLPMSSLNENLCVIIPRWVFNRYGWEISKSGQQDFNSWMEDRIKILMRTWIGHRTAIGYTVAKAIRSFQDKFNFPEDVWSFEAIKKDLQRNGDCSSNKTVENFLMQLDAEMQQIFVNNMSAKGTYISEKWKNELIKIG